MELTPDLPPELVPVAWLLGVWQGAGVIGYPTMQESRFGQQVVFDHVGGPYLTYESRLWLLLDDGERGDVLTVETGYWRPQPESQLEALIVQPTGVVEVYVGEIHPARIEMRTDVVARTVSAEEHTAGHRLYGLVEGDLLWAYDKAALGQPLSPHASARLKKVPAADVIGLAGRAQA